MDPFQAEIRLMSFNFAPRSWASCDGQSLPVNQNQALFSLLGNRFGGDGVNNFNLPNLRGGAPIGLGSGYTVGQSGGEAAHTLVVGEMPNHLHTAMGSPSTGDSAPPAGSYLPQYSNLYGPAANLTAMASGELNTVGGQPHQNMQPYLTINFCIALLGIYPARS